MILIAPDGSDTVRSTADRLSRNPGSSDVHPMFKECVPPAERPRFPSVL